MKRIDRTNIAAILAVVATLAAAAVAVTGLTRVLGITAELLVGITSTIVAFALGAVSTSLAGSVRRLSRTKRIFLSYQHDEGKEAHRLADALGKKGFRVWLDVERVRPGDSIAEAVMKGIADADALVVLLSDRPSANIAFEVGLARSKGIRIIPVRLGGAPVPFELSALKYIDVGRDQRIPEGEVATAVTGSV